MLRGQLMKKTILILLILILFICCSCGCTNNKVIPFKASYYNQAINGIELVPDENDIVANSLKDSMIIMLLYSYICEAVNNYFGEPTQWILENSKINSISKINTFNRYQISVTVPTFHGPHNPPYGLETMIFLVKPGNIFLEQYIHEDVK